MTFKIAVCAGHGFNTMGKRSPADEREWSFNNKNVLAFIEEMSKYENIEIRRYDDPTGRTDVPLRTRTNNANAWNADIYISFHHNANTGTWGSWTGTETFRGSSQNSMRLARLVQAALVKAYGLRDRGVKFANLHITRETNMPVCLTEGGFMDSTTDILKLRDDNVLRNAGIEVAKAVAEYGNLKKRNGVSSSSPSQPYTPQPVQSTVIKNGDRGDAVKSLQERLNSIGYDCGVADGVFGNATDIAVKHFQRDKGLTVDGIVGQNTLDAITKEENSMKEKIDKLEKELAELKKMITEGNAPTPSPWAKEVWDNSVYFDKTKPQAMITRQETALVVNRVISNTRKYITDPLEERISELEKQVK